MVRISVYYPGAEGKDFDHAYYHEHHYKLLVDRLTSEGMVSVQFDKGLSDGMGGKPQYVAVAHMVFPSLKEFQAAMGKHGKEIMGDVVNYTKIRPVTQISEIAAG